MIEFNFAPEKGKQWTLEGAKAYCIQQIAKSLESIEEQNRDVERAYDLLQEERERHEITKTALELMLYRSDVKNMFSDKKFIQLSDFVHQLQGKHIIRWISREALRKSIGDTDYLEVEKAGSGFRVRLIQ